MHMFPASCSAPASRAQQNMLVSQQLQPTTPHAICHRTGLHGSCKPGKSKLRTFNAMLDMHPEVTHQPPLGRCAVRQPTQHASHAVQHATSATSAPCTAAQPTLPFLLTLQRTPLLSESADVCRCTAEPQHNHWLGAPVTSTPALLCCSCCRCCCCSALRLAQHLQRRIFRAQQRQPMVSGTPPLQL
jgi:hypothetical protein